MPWRPHLIQWLEAAAESYGGDLPLPVRRRAAAPTANARLPAAEPATPRPAKKEAQTVVSDEFTSPSLEALAAEVAACEKCPLAAQRQHVVFGEGSPTARVMFIGEAPGFHEDQQGRPFVGPAGQLLDRIIENAMGMSRRDVFIANVNKCRPPRNRDPNPDEVAACLPHLKQQIRLIAPEVIVTLGRVAAHNLLATSAPMRHLRGQELAYDGIPVVATWHPAYLLRQPSAKADTWQDIKRVNLLLGHPEVPERDGGPGPRTRPAD